MEKTKANSIEMPVRHPGETSAKVPRGVPGSASSSTRPLSFLHAGASESAVQAWPTENGAAPFPPADLMRIDKVEEYVGMKSSNIYRLIGLGLFPAPIHSGGSRWIRAEVDEYIERKKEARDRERGQNKFAPRPAILTAQGTALNGSFSGSKPGSPAALPPSTIRVLSPELVEALRLLKVDIPELSLDPTAWNVSLAVIKVELSSAQPEKHDSKRRKR